MTGSEQGQAKEPLSMHGANPSSGAGVTRSGSAPARGTAGFTTQSLSRKVTPTADTAIWPWQKQAW